MADSNRVSMYYKEESTWGTSPTTGYQYLRITGESLNFNIENTVSAEIRGDRNIPDTIQTGASVGGGFNFELSYGTFDELLEGALWGSWATNVLKNGATEHSYSIERFHDDVDLYFLFKGLVVNSMSLTFSVNSIATGSFEFIGKTSTLTGTPVTSTTITAANTNSVINTVAHFGSIAITGVTMTGIFIQEISFTVNNNVRPIHTIGTLGLADIGVGQIDISGTLNVYFTNDNIYDVFLASTSVAIAFTFGAASGSKYTFSFPRVKIESDTINAGGANADVIESMTFRALYDSTNACSFKITRAVT